MSHNVSVACGCTCVRAQLLLASRLLCHLLSFFLHFLIQMSVGQLADANAVLSTPLASYGNQFSVYIYQLQHTPSHR